VSVLVFAISVVPLFLGFYRNQWGIVREKKFKSFQLDSESLVIARLVESRQAGVVSENGLLGWGDADPANLNDSDYNHQYDVYLSGQHFGTYSLYKSVSGFQAMLFGIMDGVSPFSPAENLRNYRALEALLFAITVSAFVLWVLWELGLFPALFVVAAILLSQWMTLYGHNLFYFIWASFLPLPAMSLYLHREASLPSHTANWGLGVLTFTTILFKCMMNGYDFIVPALAMPIAPVVYYGLARNWPRRVLVRRLLYSGLAIAAAVALSLIILAVQLRISEGTFVGGLSSIFSTLGRRTYGNPQLYPGYADSLEADPWSVLWTYIADDWAVERLGLSFLQVILIFAAVTALYLVLRRSALRDQADDPRAPGLIATAWLTILSPLSWFVIFKGQAYVHTHTNYLAWYMPFMLFGYAMAAYLIARLVGFALAGLHPPPSRRDESKQ
jgi:hypothetical protein